MQAEILNIHTYWWRIINKKQILNVPYRTNDLLFFNCLLSFCVICSCVHIKAICILTFYEYLTVIWITFCCRELSWQNHIIVCNHSYYVCNWLFIYLFIWSYFNINQYNCTIVLIYSSLLLIKTRILPNEYLVMTSPRVIMSSPHVIMNNPFEKLNNHHVILLDPTK